MLHGDGVVGNSSKFQGSWRGLAPYALALLAIAGIAWLLAYSSIKQTPLRTDPKQYAVAASNIAKYATFSDSVIDDPNVRPPPTHRREPAYSFLLAIVFGLDLRKVSVECLLSGEACSALRSELIGMNAVLAALVTFMTGCMTFYFTRNGAASIFAALLVATANWFGSTRLLSEGLAALLLLVHASGLAIAVSGYRDVWRKAGATVGSIALGMLILTKAVFLYWAVLLSIAWLAVALRARTKPVMILAILSVLPALIICTSWMARNHAQAGTLTAAGRDGEILTLRTAYLAMTWDEYRAGFVAFAPRDPSWLKPALGSILGNENLARFGWEQPDTFFRTGMRAKAMDEDRSRFEGQLDRDRQLRASASRAILEQPFKYAAHSILFAWRAAFPQLTPFTPGGTWSRLLNTVASYGYSLATYARLLMGVGLFFATTVFVVRGRLDGLLFVAPAIYCWGIHAAVTDGYPRYMQPAVPIMAVTLTVMIVHIMAWLRQFTAPLLTGFGGKRHRAQ